MDRKRLKQLTEDFKADLSMMYSVQDVASELFTSPQASTRQLRDIFGADFMEEAEKIFDEEELDTVQNVLDSFYNLVNLKKQI